MNISCLMCKDNFCLTTPSQIEKFCKHVNKCLLQSGNEMQDRFQCSICRTVVQLKRSFKNHITKVHFNNETETNCNAQNSNNIRHEKRILAFDASRNVVQLANATEAAEKVLVECVPSDETRNEDCPIDISRKSLKSDFDHKLLLFTSKLFGKMSLAMDTAEEILEDVEEFIEYSGSLYESGIEKATESFEKEKQKSVIESTRTTKRKIFAAFRKVNTEQKIQSVLLKKKALSLPRSKVIAEVDVQVGNDLITKKSKVTIMPIKHQIEQFLGKHDVLKSILEYQNKLESPKPGLITNFMNARRWKEVKKNFVGKNVIPVFLYNDDYGPDDGLSPHNKSNKISGYYYCFPTLPVQMASTLDSIFVAMLAKTKDIQLVGPNELLRVLVEEFEPLEREGILINGQIVHIAPVLLCGDNAGLNLNLGLGGYTSTYFCRMCFMQKKETEVCCKEKENLIRTEEHYHMCIHALENNNKKASVGIKFKTYLNHLLSFDFCHSLIADIMHDLLSGVMEYGLVALIKKAIYLKKFTLDGFNAAKNSFNFGDREKNYKFGNITKDHIKNESIRCHAREMWTLIKFLPAILDKLSLPRNCPLRKYGCLMSEILDACLKNSYTAEDLVKLDGLMQKHNQEFLRLFNNDPENPRPLPPKAHNMLHYKRIVEESGPLKDMWSMRFEAKHQHSKSYAKVCHSRRNLCYSIGKKFCFHDAHIILKNENKLKKVTEFNVSNRVYQLFADELKSSKRCDNVKFKGKLYSIGDFVLSNELTIIFKILDIAVNEISDEVVLVLGRYDVTYIEALRLYRIGENSHINSFMNVNELNNPPLSSIPFKGKLYVHHDEF